jgi:hypothetical protein
VHSVIRGGFVALFDGKANVNEQGISVNIAAGHRTGLPGPILGRIWTANPM